MFPIHRLKAAALWKWHTTFAMKESDFDVTPLRLILGVGRSGTTWVARVLGQTATPSRVVQEFLFPIRPRLRLVNGPDHTATPVVRGLPQNHRLLAAYKLMTRPSVNWAKRSIDHAIERNDPNWEVCLVKEVHALLSCEAVIRAFQCPTIFVIRDPISTVDSILRTNGKHQFYLLAEAQHLMACQNADGFASGFSRLRESYSRLAKRPHALDTATALKLVFTVAAIHLHFSRLAHEFESVHLVHYEDLCLQSDQLFQQLADAIGVDWEDDSAAKLRHFNSAPRTNSPYETRRLGAVQLAKRPSLLCSQQVALCERMLCDGGIQSFRASA